MRVWGACRSRYGKGFAGSPSQYRGEDTGVGIGEDAGAGVGLRPPVPQVQEIVFRNFYTAFLSVRVQRPGPGGSRRWVTCLRDLCLMPCPHTEEGSQDYFCLHRHQVSMSGWDRGVIPPSGAHTPGWLTVPGGSGADATLTPMVARVPVPRPAQPALTWAPSVWGGVGGLGGTPKAAPRQCQPL